MATTKTTSNRSNHTYVQDFSFYQSRLPGVVVDRLFRSQHLQCCRLPHQWGSFGLEQGWFNLNLETITVVVAAVLLALLLSSHHNGVCKHQAHGASEAAQSALESESGVSGATGKLVHSSSSS